MHVLSTLYLKTYIIHLQFYILLFSSKKIGAVVFHATNFCDTRHKYGHAWDNCSHLLDGFGKYLIDSLDSLQIRAVRILPILS